MRPEETVCQEQPIRGESVPTPVERYIPSADELRQRHHINIEFLSSGCVVRIGCKSIAFTSYNQAVEEVRNYAIDPVAAYKKWGKELNVEL